MRRSPFIQSSTSALLFKPVISRGGVPGYSATIVQSSSALRTGLKVTFAFAMRPYAAYPAKREPPCAGPASVPPAAGVQPGFCKDSVEVKANFEETDNAADGVCRHRIGV